MALQPLVPDPNNPSPPPNLDNQMSMGGAMPQLSNPGLKDLVTTPRQQQEQALQAKILSYENPQKPQGFWQNVRHDAANIGKAALTAFAPELSATLPGMPLNDMMQQRERTRELAGLQTADREDSTAATTNTKADADAGEATERTRLYGDQANEIEHPAPPPEPSLAQAYAHAVQAATKAGKDPDTDPIVMHMREAITSLQKPTAPKSLESKEIVGPNGKPMMANYHPDTGSYTDAAGKPIANPVPYIKPTQGRDPSIEADREFKQFGAPYQKGNDAAVSQLEKIDKTSRSIDAGYIGQNLAIPELLTSLVSGQGTGVRITQAELNSIGKGRGVSGDVESFFNGLAGKGKLTDTDKSQMKAILSDAQQRIQQKQQIHKDALDAIESASDRSGRVAADKDARQKLSDLERGGTTVGGTTQNEDDTGYINGVKVRYSGSGSKSDPKNYAPVK